MTQQYPYPPQPPIQPVQPPAKKHTVRNIVIAITVGGFLLIGGCAALVAIGADSASKDSTKQTVTESTTPATAPSTTAPDEPAATPEPTQTDDAPDVAKIGATEWFTYEDGIKVQVTRAKPYKIGSYAAGGKPGGQGVVITVTIKNGSKATFDSDLADVTLASGPNGDQAERVFDSATDGLGFTGSIAPGRSKTAKFAFAVPKAHLSQLQIEVTPSWEHEGSLFEGPARK